jgi:hypothetical protein
MTSAKPTGAGEPMASTSAACAGDAATDTAIAQATRESARTRAAPFAAAKLLFSTIGLFRSVQFRTSPQTGLQARLARFPASGAKAAN